MGPGYLYPGAELETAEASNVSPYFSISDIRFACADKYGKISCTF